MRPHPRAVAWAALSDRVAWWLVVIGMVIAVLGLLGLLGIGVHMAYANDLRVTWTNPTDGDPATEIRIERSLHCSGRYPYEQVNVLPPSATSYYDAGLNDGEEYCYRIRHCNAQGCGGYTTATGNRTRRLPTGRDFQMSAIQGGWA